MRRRELLHLMACAVPACTAAGRVFAAPPGSPRFLLVFLRGGYDCANILIPYSSAYYYETRPNIAVRRPTGQDTGGALALDSDWALAPALRSSVALLYAQRQALFIPFAGTEDLSRSHFETQDDIELGQAASGRVQGSPDLRSGFMARLAGVVNGAAPIAFTDSLPVCFRGSADIPNISLKGVGRLVFDARQAAILSAMYTGHHLQPQVEDGLELRQEVSRAMEQEMKEASRDALTPKGFELEARRVGRLMRDQYRIGFIDVGGWDTHVNEGSAQGALANNIDSLGKGLTALSQELGAEWRNTVVAVVSEFGRTFRENGNKGTDHGHGSVYWILGGSINGGRVAGEQTGVTRENLFQDRDYPVLNEYRAVLGGLFAALWGLSPEQVQQVFPASTPVDLKVI
ncbi:MAG TPA: DUF1501 domain-containing protein [Steroidobacteraceae bacterium]|nr:DUF1501 domain-containing protein [Steroidobacteraceae bacterium]